MANEGTHDAWTLLSNDSSDDGKKPHEKTRLVIIIIFFSEYFAFVGERWVDTSGVFFFENCCCKFLLFMFDEKMCACDNFCVSVDVIVCCMSLCVSTHCVSVSLCVSLCLEEPFCEAFFKVKLKGKKKKKKNVAILEHQSFTRVCFCCF